MKHVWVDKIGKVGVCRIWRRPKKHNKSLVNQRDLLRCFSHVCLYCLFWKLNFWTDARGLNIPVDIMVPPHLLSQFHSTVRKNKLSSQVFIPDVQKWVKQILVAVRLFSDLIYIVSFPQSNHPSVHCLLYSYAHFFFSCCNFLIEPYLSQPLLSDYPQISFFSFSLLCSDVYSSERVWDNFPLSSAVTVFVWNLSVHNKVLRSSHSSLTETNNKHNI